MSVCLDVREGESGVGGGGTNLDGDQRIEATDGGFKRSQTQIVIGEDAKPRRGGVYSKGYTRLGNLALASTRPWESRTKADLHRLFCGLEPGFALGLFEDVVENGIVGVVLARHWLIKEWML